jgi:hypothetical protein
VEKKLMEQRLAQMAEDAQEKQELEMQIEKCVFEALERLQEVCLPSSLGIYASK